MRARKRPVFLALRKVLICALRARHCIVYSWVQKNTGLFREGTDHAPLVNYPKGHENMRARKRPVFFWARKVAVHAAWVYPKF